MINRKSAILLVVISICFMYYSPTTSYACSCVEPGPVQDELERSSVVFSGTVIDMLDVNKNKSIQSSADPIAVQFEVEEAWKGLGQTQIIVYTERDSASCGYEFTLNKKYLVYAQEIEGELKAGLCSRTTPLSSAEMDLDELGFGDKPTEQVSIDLAGMKDVDQISFKSIVFNNPIYYIVFIALLIIVAIYVIRRNKNNNV